MHRYVLTGAPGAGKTVLIQLLEQQDFSIIEEAATDIIAIEQAGGVAEPWTEADFIERIAVLQMQRARLGAALDVPVQFHDRSIFCTYALALFLGRSIPDALDIAIRQALETGYFRKRAFFIRLMGFITPTDARRINFAEAIRFERVHEETYRKFGFELFPVDAGSIAKRANVIARAVAADQRGGAGIV